MPHELHHEGFGVLRFALILAPVWTIKSGRLEVLFSRYVHFLCNNVLAKLGIWTFNCSVHFHNGRYSSIVIFALVWTQFYNLCSVLRNISILRSDLLWSSPSGSTKWIIILIKWSRLIGVHKRLAFWALHMVRWFMNYTRQ